MLPAYADVPATAVAGTPRFRVAAGEILVVDNDRMMHGRNGFRGRRALCGLTVPSAEAWR